MKIKKALLSIAVISTLCIQQLPAFGADNNFAQAVLNSASATETLIDVWAGESKVTPSLSTVGGKTGWVTDKSNNESAKNIYCNVDDSYLFNNVESIGVSDSKLKGDAVEVAVEYYDAPAGLFSIIYNSVNNSLGWEKHITEAEYPVELTGTNTWKTHTFRLYDTRFANELNGADFVIKTYDRGDTSVNNEDVEFRNMYYTAGDITFGSITVRKIPIVADFISGCVGNIFTGTGEKQVTVNFENTTNKTVNTTVSYELVSVQTNTAVWNSSLNETFYPNQTARKAVTIPFEKYGTYILKISTSAADGVVSTEREFECSVVVDNENVRDDRFGVNTHLWESLWGGGKYTETLTDLVANSGSGWIRDSVRWGDYEKNAGEYKIPDSAMNAIDTAISKGINVLMILHGTNDIYKGAESFPYSTDVLDEFELYCENIARDLTGKVEIFETINEYHWQSLGADYYIEVLKATYNGVKRGNPKAKIVGFDLALVPVSFMTQVAQKGGLQYMDAVSVHPYSTSGNPDVSPLIDNMQSLKSLIDTYGGNQEIWMTELGWSNSINDWYTGNVIEDFSYEEAAAWQIKAYAHTIGRGTADKLLIYDFMNDNYDYGGKESNYGMIESHYAEEGVPFAAQQEYVSAAFMTKMLADAVPGNYTFTNNTYNYKFNRADGSSVDVVWNTQNSGTVNLTLPENGTTVIYDMYGNVIKTLDNLTNDTYSQQLGAAPLYVEYNTANKGYIATKTLVSDDFDGGIIDMGKWNNTNAESSQVIPVNKAVKLNDIYEHKGLGFKLDEPLTDGTINIKYDMFIPAGSVDETTGKYKGEFLIYGGNEPKDTTAITWLNGGTMNLPGVGAVFAPQKETRYTIDVTLDVATRYVTVKATDGTNNWSGAGINKYPAISETSQIMFGAKYLDINKSQIILDNISVTRSCESLEIDYSINDTENEATVNAKLSAKDAGKTVSFMIFKDGKSFEDLDEKPLESLVYVSQDEVDENGLYSVNFKIPEEKGFYNAYLAPEGYDNRYELDLLVGSDFVVISSVSQNGEPVNSLAGLDATQDMKVTVRGANKSKEALNMNLIYAFYNEGMLTDLQINNIYASETEFTRSYTAQGPLNNGQPFDQVKFFVWNNSDNITSLCKNVHLF